MWKDLFVKRKYATLKITQKDSERIDNISLDDIDVNMFTKCPSCGEILINMDLENNLKVCYKCNYHFRIGSKERINITFDKGSIEYFDNNMKSLNPLGFIDYSQKLKSLSKSLGINEAVVTGKAKINGYDLCFGVMEPNFIMGSMGSVVGEKLSRMFEKAIELNLPVVVFCASGGARMQEGMLSLCQMAKVSAAVKMHSNKGLLYISVITDPTTGGVTASFASLGDIIIAEPKATIGFAGRRVIEQTIKQKLPDEFQSAEFMLEHGFIDIIVERKKMKETLSNILKIHLGVKK
ncbi:acetyl-CoA carboxylase carboxyltransferase subunit beta [Caloramator sp. E03]|uniref:acetyl-CoA carboxylase, carboxyltransferase subunit beta n=1 Tax=Caloramator sp. E03 TaxID=2576307 RepID=UPI001110A349|nr:acetyl-CoA carboxylase, carboxyltransferase subunit beta [Caloramator sp. E03]QCX33799.1 acetyl-CoA carboxylase carboxyltransferase subunit beta [Caloramator sp. E03]